MEHIVNNTDFIAQISSKGQTERHFHYWKGSSGTTYLHSVFPAENAPYLANANVMIVREAGGLRHPVYIGQTGALPELLFASPGFRRAIASGGNEIHIHLLGSSSFERTRIEKDIASNIPGATCNELVLAA